MEPIVDEFKKMVTKRQRTANGRIAKEGPDTQCSNCHTTQTTQWRRDKDGSTVCNACGCYYNLHGHKRPSDMRRNAIHTRRRRSGRPGEDGGSTTPTQLTGPFTSGDSFQALVHYQQQLLNGDISASEFNTIVNMPENLALRSLPTSIIGSAQSTHSGESDESHSNVQSGVQIFNSSVSSSDIDGASNLSRFDKTSGSLKRKRSKPVSMSLKKSLAKKHVTRSDNGDINTINQSLLSTVVSPTPGAISNNPVEEQVLSTLEKILYLRSYINGVVATNTPSVDGGANVDDNSTVMGNDEATYYDASSSFNHDENDNEDDDDHSNDGQRNDDNADHTAIKDDGETEDDKIGADAAPDSAELPFDVEAYVELAAAQYKANMLRLLTRKPSMDKMPNFFPPINTSLLTETNGKSNKTSKS